MSGNQEPRGCDITESAMELGTEVCRSASSRGNRR